MWLFINWLILAASVLISAYLLPGVHVANAFTAILVALVLGLINIFIKPFIILLTLPVTILTLGLFVFVINAFLIMLTAQIVSGFQVRNFGWALLFSLILTVVHGILKNAVRHNN